MKFLNDFLDNNEPANLWPKYREFCDNLKDVDIDIYVQELPALLKKIQNLNYPLNNLNIALQREAKNNTSFGREIYSKTLETNNPDLYSTLPDIISGLYCSDQNFATEEIKGLIKSDNKILKNIGIQTLAKFDLSNSSTSKAFIRWIEKKLAGIINQESEAELWPSVFFVARVKRNELKNSDALINKLSTINTINIQLELLYFICYNINFENEINLVKKYLPVLLHIDLEHQGIYNQLSYNLGVLAKHDLSLVVVFLTDWVEMDIKNARKIGYFSHFLNTLFDEYYNDFQKLYTTWLNKDNPNFHIAIFEMNQTGEIRNLAGLTVSEHVLKDLSDYDIEYITYKILAYVYDKDTSISLVYSILNLKIDNNEVVGLLSNLFINHFIFNYYSVIDFLNEKNKTASKRLKIILNDIIREGEDKYKAFSELDMLKEFAPSERRLTYYNKIQNKKFNKSYKESETKGSSFLSMINTIHFRAGKSSFSQYRGKYTDKMTPALISHSGELPRGEFIDPIGQAKERLLWQNFKRRG